MKIKNKKPTPKKQILKIGHVSTKTLGWSGLDREDFVNDKKVRF